MFKFLKKESKLDKESREASTIIMASAYAIDNIRRSGFTIETGEGYKLVARLYGEFCELYNKEIGESKNKDKLYLIFVQFVRRYLEQRNLSVLIDISEWMPEDENIYDEVSEIHYKQMLGNKMLETLNASLGKNLTISDIK